jgi:glucose-1-phosphate adenylyltransferase
MDYSALVDFHVQNDGDITIGTIPVSAKDAPGFGILKSNENNEITSFTEKPSSELLPEWTSDVSAELQKQGREFLASMGIYVFSKKVLKKLLTENRGMDFGKDIIPDAIGNYRVLGYQYDSYWTDIGTIGSFFEANIQLTDNVPAFNLFGESIYTRARMLPPSKILGTTLNNTIVADGCIILADKIERSVIGVRSRIGGGSVLRQTYMMGSDYYEKLDEVVEMSNTQQPPPIGLANVVILNVRFWTRIAGLVMMCG